MGSALVAAIDAAATEAKCDTLPLMLGEEMARSAGVPVAEPTGSPINAGAPTADKPQISPAAELFDTVRVILERELVTAHTEEDVTKLLGVTKTQAKAWLARLVEAAALEKVMKPKPVRYRAVEVGTRLL